MRSKYRLLPRLMPFTSTCPLVDGVTRTSPVMLWIATVLPAAIALSQWKSLRCACSEAASVVVAKMVGRRRIVVPGEWSGSAFGRRSPTPIRRDRDVAAEGLGSDARRASADLERELFTVRRADPVLARAERDRELTVDAAIPGGDGELRARLPLNVEVH